VFGAAHVDLAGGDVHSEELCVAVGEQVGEPAGAAAKVDRAAGGFLVQVGDGGGDPGPVDRVGVGGEGVEQIGEGVEVGFLLGHGRGHRRGSLHGLVSQVGGQRGRPIEWSM